MSRETTTTTEEFVLDVAEKPVLPRLPVVNQAGETIGHVELSTLPGTVSRDDFDHLRHDLIQLRNQVLRLQTQVKLLENRLPRHGADHY